MCNPQILRKHPYLLFLFFLPQPQSVKKWRSNDGGKQKNITDALVSFVASDLQPLSVIESIAFRQILERAEPHCTVPSRKHLSSQLIPKRFTDLFTKVVTLLKSAEQVCLSLDIWSNRQMRSYLGVTVHFITEFHLRVPCLLVVSLALTQVNLYYNTIWKLKRNLLFLAKLTTS